MKDYNDWCMMHKYESYRNSDTEHKIIQFSEYYWNFLIYNFLMMMMMMNCFWEIVDQQKVLSYFQWVLLWEIVTISNIQHVTSRNSNCTELKFRLYQMKLHSSDNHYNQCASINYYFFLHGFYQVFEEYLDAIILEKVQMLWVYSY